MHIDPLLVVVPIALAIALSFVGTVVALAIARRAGLLGPRSEGPDTECVACGSRDLARPLPDVYLCGACGYEGGSGFAAYEHHKWKERVAAMAPADRERLGRQLASEAARCLLSADGMLDASRRELDGVAVSTGYASGGFQVQVSFGGAPTSANDGYDPNADALSELLRAHALLRDAAWLIEEAELPITVPDTLRASARSERAALVRLRRDLTPHADRLRPPSELATG